MATSSIHRVSRLFTLSLLAVVAGGCSPMSPGGDETADDELNATCELGRTCPASVRLLGAASYLDRRPPDLRRVDVDVDVLDPAWERHPRAFSRGFAGPYMFRGGKRILLSGSADGLAPLRVDDMILIEVRTVGTDALIRAALINPVVGTVRMSGSIVPPLATAPAWGGVNQGWSYPGGTLDIAPLLPVGVPFTIRLTALDVASSAVVTDVFARAEDAGGVAAGTLPYTKHPLGAFRATGRCTFSFDWQVCGTGVCGGGWSEDITVTGRLEWTGHPGASLFTDPFRPRASDDEAAKYVPAGATTALEFVLDNQGGPANRFVGGLHYKARVSGETLELSRTGTVAIGDRTHTEQARRNYDCRLTFQP